ncbi:hypothetical protein EVAR_40302_1 [Eumeta japonica]|uniref:Uncharacterized protein n=1 Tax=Eumeta variegata TaxID=151549 RepID=A0A4C1Y943_EUMVA|nr:hypothetical protein EVAR_40302_1 [Eumeta japonica]
MLTSRSLPLTLFIALCSANISAWNTVQKDSSRNVEFPDSISSATLSGPHLLYLRSYCRRYICAARQWRDGRLLMDPGPQRLEPEFGSVRGMRHFAEVHGLRAPGRHRRPRFTSALHLESLAASLTRMSGEQPREDQRGMEGDTSSSACFHATLRCSASSIFRTPSF